MVDFEVVVRCLRTRCGLENVVSETNHIFGERMQLRYVCIREWASGNGAPHSVGLGRFGQRWKPTGVHDANPTRHRHLPSRLRMLRAPNSVADFHVAGVTES